MLLSQSASFCSFLVLLLLLCCAECRRRRSSGFVRDRLQPLTVCQTAANGADRDTVCSVCLFMMRHFFFVPMRNMAHSEVDTCDQLFATCDKASWPPFLEKGQTLVQPAKKCRGMVEEFEARWNDRDAVSKTAEEVIKAGRVVEAIDFEVRRFCTELQCCQNHVTVTRAAYPLFKVMETVQQQVADAKEAKRRTALVTDPSIKAEDLDDFCELTPKESIDIIQSVALDIEQTYADIGQPVQSLPENKAGVRRLPLHLNSMTAWNDPPETEKGSEKEKEEPLLPTLDSCSGRKTDEMCHVCQRIVTKVALLPLLAQSQEYPYPTLKFARRRLSEDSLHKAKQLLVQKTGGGVKNKDGSVDFDAIDVDEFFDIDPSVLYSVHHPDTWTCVFCRFNKPLISSDDPMRLVMMPDGMGLTPGTTSSFFLKNITITLSENVVSRCANIGREIATESLGGRLMTAIAKHVQDSPLQVAYRARALSRRGQHSVWLDKDENPLDMPELPPSLSKHLETDELFTDMCHQTVEELSQSEGTDAVSTDMLAYQFATAEACAQLGCCAREELERQCPQGKGSPAEKWKDLGRAMYEFQSPATLQFLKDKAEAKREKVAEEFKSCTLFQDAAALVEGEEVDVKKLKQFEKFATSANVLLLKTDPVAPLVHAGCLQYCSKRKPETTEESSFFSNQHAKHEKCTKNCLAAETNEWTRISDIRTRLCESIHKKKTSRDECHVKMLIAILAQLSPSCEVKKTAALEAVDGSLDDEYNKRMRFLLDYLRMRPQKYRIK